MRAVLLQHLDDTSLIYLLLTAVAHLTHRAAAAACVEREISHALAMELQQPRLPVPVAIEHHPEARNWPTPPTTALIPNVPATDVRLPGLKAVLSPEYEHSPAYSETNHHHPHSPASVRSLPPIDVGHANAYGYHNRHSSTAVLSPMESGSAMSIDGEQSRAMSVASIEDPKEREAAEALAGLGNPGNIHQT